jgi:hypothetical protein
MIGSRNASKLLFGAMEILDKAIAIFNGVVF